MATQWVERIGTGLFALLLAVPLFRGPGAHHAPPSEDHWRHPLVARDLEQIKKDTLRVLVLRDPLSWESRPGANTGLEWELLERFAKRQHLHIKAIPVAGQDSMLMLLQQGHGDVIAAQLSPFGWAASATRHTRAYRSVAHCTAHARDLSGPGPIKDMKQAADTLLVSTWSPFLDSLGRLRGTDSSTVLKLDPRTPEELLVAVALGKANNLLVSDASASMEAKRLPLVRFGPREGRSVGLVFAVRTNAVHLVHALDTWLALADEHDAREAIISAYDNGLDTRKPRLSFGDLAFGGDTISPYDSLFQAHADSLPWDWKLLAAVAYTESRFDTAACSKAGAGGLMQMMPSTATLMGVDGSGVNDHIGGAARYLDRLDRIWRKDIPGQTQRLKFVLASYNAGPGHVKDAQRLARELGLDPRRWNGNVERAIVLLNRPGFFVQPLARSGYCRGQDTFRYVREVTRSYAWLMGREAR
jgi:membrane-bound lytic murein transglycosylase F